MITIADKFWKCVFGMQRRSIDKGPVVNLTPKTTGRGTAGLLLLKRHYSALEKNPDNRITELDMAAIKYQSTTNGKISCQYCDKEVEAEKITVDHVVPLYFGGLSSFSNLKLCCPSCNSMKGSIHSENMPHTWSLFQRNLKDKVYAPALVLLVEAKKETSLSEKEQYLIQKLEKKELEWREKKVKTLKRKPLPENLVKEKNDMSQKAA